MPGKSKITAGVTRLKIALLFGNPPNLDKYALKYFILSLNKLQSSYEFFFPDSDSYAFTQSVCLYETCNSELETFVKNSRIIADYHIAIITIPFDNDYFSRADNKTAVITTVGWEKYFSPPSLFEFILFSIIDSLIYSDLLPGESEEDNGEEGINYESHDDTWGCISDFTGDKFDSRIDIILGYICDEHKEAIREYYGELYLQEITQILERKWIGNISEQGSIAHQLKHVFKFDINKDSGFNKTLWEKCQDKFYEIPGNLVGEVFKVLLTAFLTYFLIKYGIQKSTKG
jgi:hypothetical protein